MKVMAFNARPDERAFFDHFGQSLNMDLELQPGTLTVDNCTEEEFMQIWTPYLDLERDYAKIKSGLKGEQIQKAVEYGYGIRILKQEFGKRCCHSSYRRITIYRGLRAALRL